MQNSFSQKIGNATKWSAITEFSTKLIAPLTNAILARLLAPEMFGIVATLTLVITFAEIFTDAGFQKYIVQHEFVDQEDLDLSTNVAFWTNLILSLTIWGGIVIFVKPIAELIGASGNESAIVVISAQIPLLAFSSIQMARYRRDFAFKNLFAVRMGIALVPLFVTIPFAFIFRNHWALVMGTLARDLLSAVVLTVYSKWKPSFRFSVKKLKEMLSFSIWSVVENVTIWVAANAGIIAVTTFLGAYYIGLYKTTNATVSGYMGIFTTSTMPVLFSSLSRCQDDDEAFRNVYFKFQRMVALIVFPLGFGCFIYRDLVTLILLGTQWLETSDYLGMLFLTRAMEMIFSYYNSEAFRSIGKPKLSVFAQLIYILAQIPVLMWSAQYGYEALTIAACVTSYVLITATSSIAHFVLKLRFSSVISNVWPSLISSCVMSVAGVWLLSLSYSIMWHVVSVCICMVVYGCCMVIIPAGRRQMAEIPILKRLLRLK